MFMMESKAKSKSEIWREDCLVAKKHWIKKRARHFKMQNDEIRIMKGFEWEGRVCSFEKLSLHFIWI